MTVSFIGKGQRFETASKRVLAALERGLRNTQKAIDEHRKRIDDPKGELNRLYGVTNPTEEQIKRFVLDAINEIEGKFSTNIKIAEQAIVLARKAVEAVCK